MELLLTRKWTDTSGNRTIGCLDVDSSFFCFTLEDRIREQPGQSVYKWKVRGATAIPSGRYEITLQLSPKFGPDTLTILNVLGFQYIRLHAGNDEHDTEGCVLVGDQLTESLSLAKSRPALERLKSLVKEARGRGERVWIDIRTDVENAMPPVISPQK